MINNNKGFAFSTMLYGLLAVMMVLLMLIFSLYKNTSDEIYYYSSQADEKLNQCAITEIALENCYASGSSCKKFEDAYFGCLGIEKEGSGTHLNLFQKVSSTVVTSGNGLYKLSDDSYVFRGALVNNYVKYDDRLWRIISFTRSGEAKIIDVSSNSLLTLVSWDLGGNKEWEDSSLYALLQGNYYAGLSDKDLLVPFVWDVGRPNVDDRPTLAQLKNFEKSALSRTTLYVGLLNTSDFAQASLNSTCQNSPLDSGVSCRSDNYLASSATWTMNSSNGSNSDAFMINGERIEQKDVTFETAARPVVYISNQAEILNGDGSSGSPYIIG